MANPKRPCCTSKASCICNACLSCATSCQPRDVSHRPPHRRICLQKVFPSSLYPNHRCPRPRRDRAQSHWGHWSPRIRAMWARQRAASGPALMRTLAYRLPRWCSENRRTPSAKPKRLSRPNAAHRFAGARARKPGARKHTGAALCALRAPRTATSKPIRQNSIGGCVLRSVRHRTTAVSVSYVQGCLRMTEATTSTTSRTS